MQIFLAISTEIAEQIGLCKNELFSDYFGNFTSSDSLNGCGITTKGVAFKAFKQRTFLSIPPGPVNLDS